ncbi:MAG: LPS-assembly protein LptD [Sphingobacteriia bacterium]|nr:LPS-assembly protein LptD [Sphingobacteriia bacterium]
MIRIAPNNVKIIGTIVCLAMLWPVTAWLSPFKVKLFSIVTNAEKHSDTIPVIPKNRNRQDTFNANKTDTSLLSNKKDSIERVRIDSLTLSKDSLDAPVKYAAKDSGVLMIDSKEFILYGKSNVAYKDLMLDAQTIRYDQESQLVKAYGGTDSANSPINKAQFKQGSSNSISDSIIYNMKSMKGLTKNTYYNEGEIYVNAQVLKKADSNIFYGYRSRFTTCNYDTPHFAFVTRKMKLINNKIAVSGPASPMFEGVPVPIGIPFGIYPIYNGRHSGVLIPAFTVSEDYGFGLEGLGYYKVVNDYWDVTTRANLYSYGGWMLNILPKYIKRYRYTGSFSLSLQNTKALNKSVITKDQFTSFSTYMINWSHSQDNRARPGTTFGASVNFGSTKYNQTLLNNPYQNYLNQLSSSISYSKNFNNKANLSLNINHNQNSNTHLVNLSLPNASVSVMTIYPFQKKERAGSLKWWESIGVGYSGNFQNQISFYDTAGTSFKRVLDTAQWGATHSIPVTITLPQVGPFTISPSVSFSQRWYGQSIMRTWDSVKQKLDTSIHKGFYTASEVTFGINASTRIFGTFKFGHGDNTKKIRHEVRPNIGFSYKPDLVSKYFYSTQVDTTGRKVRMSQFDGVVPGTYSEGTFGGISFGIDNLLEMKVRDKKDTAAAATKKIKLLDGFGISSAYNLMADSFALSPFSLYARSTLFEKINITGNATIDPYVVDKYGYRVNKYAWQAGSFKLGTINYANIAVSTSFKSKSKSGKTDKDRLQIDPFLTPDEQQRQLQYARANPAEFTDFDIPWNLSLSYSLNYNRLPYRDTAGIATFQNVITSNMNFNGDFSLTEKWKIGAAGYYSFNGGGMQQLSMFITREMHCWQLAINVTPIGKFKTFNFTISPKSGILRDLRINRSRSFSAY